MMIGIKDIFGIWISVNRCESAPYLKKTHVFFTSSDYLSVAIYTCEFGHRFPDGSVEKQLTCVNGHWIGDLDECSGMLDSSFSVIDV